MANLNIIQFSDIADTVRGSVQVGKWPASAAADNVAIGGSSVQSNAFDATTRIVRLHTDTACAVSFGTSPTAATTDCQLSANQTEYFGVPLSGGFKVAVIAT